MLARKAQSELHVTNLWNDYPLECVSADADARHRGSHTGEAAHTPLASLEGLSVLDACA
jgi:hypothetical protein